MGVALDLLAEQPHKRRLWLAEQTEHDREYALVAVRQEYGTPYAVYRDDPVGFLEDVLGDFLWSRQRLIARSVYKHKRTAVPACVGPGKTFLAGRLVCWFVSTSAPGEALVATTAHRWRQVKSQLWPHIRTSARDAGLPGRILQTEWWLGDHQAAYGFATSEYDESSVAGIHPPPGERGRLMIIVDEAGGIAPLLGNQLNGLLTGDARILCIGNPSTDEDSSWFEGVCGGDVWNSIPIPASATPNFTGEKVPDHVAKQLIGPDFVADTARQFGEDSSYYIAKIMAGFPKVFSSKVVPVGWCEDAMENENPAQSGWQRLGVDVASDGGDEMVVAYLDGWTASIVDVWAGADSSNQVVNARRVLEWILKAEGRQRQLGYTAHKVRVKVDGIGIGSGTTDILTEMGRDGLHGAEIVKVNVAQKATDEGKFGRRRAEMWWTFREVVRDGTIRLKIDEKAKAQITGPQWFTSASGKIEIEKKERMKARGLPSPDRGDAVALAVYEPEPVGEAASYAQQLAEAKVERLARRHD